MNLGDVFNILGEFIGIFWIIIKWFFTFLPNIIIGLMPFLGIEDAIITHIIGGVIILVLSTVFGFYLTFRDKRKIWSIIGTIVGFVSAIFTIASII